MSVKWWPFCLSLNVSEIVLYRLDMVNIDFLYISDNKDSWIAID